MSAWERCLRFTTRSLGDCRGLLLRQIRLGAGCVGSGSERRMAWPYFQQAGAVVPSEVLTDKDRVSRVRLHSMSCVNILRHGVGFRSGWPFGRLGLVLVGAALTDVGCVSLICFQPRMISSSVVEESLVCPLYVCMLLKVNVNILSFSQIVPTWLLYSYSWVGTLSLMGRSWLLHVA